MGATQCDDGAPIDRVEQTSEGRGGTLSYDPTTDRYTYVFKTYPAWAKRCRTLVLRFRDETERTAAWG